MCESSRRSFLVGCSAAIAGLAGSRFNSLAFGSTSGTTNEDILVVLFLRGGMDGLNLVPPIGGADRGFYEALRPALKVPVSGPGAALPLGGTGFGLHPAAAPLHELYQDGKLAIVQAVGMHENQRSHFDSMDWMELGTPGISSATSGWLTRHLLTAPNLPAQIVMPSLAVGATQTTSLLGSYETINLQDVSTFSLNIGPWRWLDAQRVALRHLYSGNDTWLHQTGLQTLNALDIIELNAGAGYTPGNGAVYPESFFGGNLQLVAQMVKLELGLRVATVDLGGWDTHENQGNGAGGYYAGLVGELAQGLSALYTDLSGPTNYTNRMTIVVMSEFGRRAYQNGDDGTDHGHANQMLVLSGNAIGGLHGQWPGLAPGALYEGDDVAVTTDFRRVLTEILIRRLGNSQIPAIFPGYAGYSPLGVVQGTDIPVGGIPIFDDGFESGNLSAWSQVVP